METLACTKCGSLSNSTRAVNNVHQNELFCNDCGSHIKWAGKKPALYSSETGYDLEAQIKCVKREIGKRQGVYSNLVKQNKMKPEKAEEEIQTMQAVLTTLETIKQSA